MRMEMDKMREEFEEWFNEIGSASVLADTVKDDTGNYYFPETRLLWACWKASRQSLVVELPLWRHSQGAQVYWPEEVRQSLEDAGIKWKS